ncbi:MAG: exonuclease, partial [Planctomyces sp.]
MHDVRWILSDTETNGLAAPIHVVELAAQRMCGWTPQGPSFRRLINPVADIAPGATLVHGYTRE